MTYLDLQDRLRELADDIGAGRATSEELDKAYEWLALDAETVPRKELDQAEDRISHLEDRVDDLKRALFEVSEELRLHANAYDNIADDVQNEPTGYGRADIARDLRAESKRVRDTSKRAELARED